MDIKNRHAHKIVLSKPKEQNSYWQACPEMFDQLLCLVSESPHAYALKLNANGRRRDTCPMLPYAKLKQWIDDVTAFKLSSSFYTAPTKCWWILNDIRDFPCCAGCGKNEGFVNVNVHLQSGYPRNCSMKCRQHDPMTLQHRKQTCRKRYGVDNPWQDEGIKRKCERAKLEKHGDPHFTNVEKRKATFKRHCEEDPEFLSRAYEKRCKTSREHFGYDNCAQCPEIIAKAHKKYMFGGMMLDSSLEIAYAAWMQSKGETVQRADKSFKYVFNGKTHNYIPDFYLPEHSMYVEVKGSHFFKSSDGTMMIPWRKKNWTDEEYQLRCQQEEAKHQCMLANGVKLLLDTSADIKQAVQYMRSAYGRDYAKQFRYTKTRS